MSKFFEDKRNEAFGVDRHASMGSIRAKNMEMITRKEEPGDELAIRQVLLSAFRSEQEARLVDRLRQNGRPSISLVAESSSTIIGQIAFSPVTLISQLESKSGLGLAPLAVVPQWQRHGAGAELVRAGLAACADAGGEFVVVLGEPSYYRRFGFQKASLLGIENEYGVDDEFMIAPLRAESLAPGLAKYASEFADVSTTH